MDNKSFCKVLLLNSTFNDNTAGGITLTNMFKYWPKECIANAYSSIDIQQSDEIRPCEMYYEFKDMNLKKQVKNSTYTISHKKNIITKLRALFFNFLTKLYLKSGLVDLIPDKRMTPEFLDFINQFKPDVIFDPAASIREMKFLKALYKETHIPIAIHVWDDFPANPASNNRFFNRYWKYKYNKEFRSLLRIVTYRYSICEKMSIEYKKRYSYDFYPIHNPVDVSLWDSIPNTTFDKSKVSILYLGKLVPATESAIFEMCSAVEFLNENGYNVIFNIYTHQSSQYNKEKVEKYKGCFLHPSNLPKEEIPKLMKNSSLLYLPLSFEEHNARYSRLSMLTKVSEYLVSSVPILLYAPKDSALYEYLAQNNAACLCNYGKNNLIKSLQRLIEDSKYRDSISKSAHKLAVERHNIPDVCENFRLSFQKNK